MIGGSLAGLKVLKDGMAGVQFIVSVASGSVLNIVTAYQ